MLRKIPPSCRYLFWFIVVLLLIWFLRVSQFLHRYRKLQSYSLCIYSPVVVLFVVFSNKVFVFWPGILRYCSGNDLNMYWNFVERILLAPSSTSNACIFINLVCYQILFNVLPPLYDVPCVRLCVFIPP